MKAIVYRGKENVVLKNIPKPSIGHFDVLIRIRTVGICGTDLHIYHGGMKMKRDAVMGHEFAGMIAAVGRHVKSLRIGDRVVAEHIIACGQCVYCLAGKPNLCLRAEVIGFHRQGALAEYLAVPANLVHKVPRSVSMEEAAMIEPLSIAVYAVREAGSLIGRNTAVVGQGPIGLLVDQVLHAAGSHVVGIDVRDVSLKFAKRKGWIDYAINASRGKVQNAIKKLFNDGFDVVFEVVGKEQTAQLSINIARRDGDVYFLGVFGAPASLNVMEIVEKELNIYGVWRCAFSFPEAIDLVAKKKVDVKSLITHVYPIEKAEQALKDASAYAGNRIKTIIRF